MGREAGEGVRRGRDEEGGEGGVGGEGGGEEREGGTVPVQSCCSLSRSVQRSSLE